MPKYSKRKDGRYVYQFSAGYDQDGKRIIKTVYGKTVPELEAKIREYRNGPLIRSSVGVAEYCMQYVNTFKANRAENTIQMYRHSIDYHIAKDFEGMRLQDLTATDVQNAVNNLSDKRRTAEIMLVLLKQACSQAIDDGIIQKNPCKKIELPTKKKNVDKRALTDQEKEKIRTADFTDKEKAFVFLLYGCGLRREEALGLRIKNINLSKMTLEVKQVIVFPDNAAVVKDYPKNDTSLRKIPIPSSCVPYIAPLISSKNDPNDFLFDEMSKTVYLKFWKRIKDKIGSYDLTAHIFRHNYATMLYYSGITIKQAAALMGHSTTKMIMDVYAHIDSQKEDVANKLNNII